MEHDVPEILDGAGRSQSVLLGSTPCTEPSCPWLSI